MNKDQKDIIEEYVKAYNNFDVIGMTKNLAKDVIFESVSDGKVDLRIEGLDAFIQQAEKAKDYFTERTQTIESWEFNDAQVTIQIAYKAILAIDFPNGLKAGETLEMKGTSVFELEQGVIKSFTDKS